jgi:hypothetical protein
MKHFSSFAAVVLLFFVSSCNTSPGTTTLPGAWDKMGDFDGLPRSGAANFVLNGKAFIVTGYNYVANADFNDTWMYDPTQDTWTQMADFPGVARQLAAAFTIGNKAYVGTGQDINRVELSDFYEFDPSNGAQGTWTKIADFGFSSDQGAATVSPRHGALGFTVANRGFVGGGDYISTLKDMWEYDNVNDVWIKRPSLGGSKRENAFVMVIDDIAYIGGGSDQGQGGIVNVDFFRFDPSKIETSTSPWTALTQLTGKDVNGNAIVQPRPRELAVGFAIGGFGYLTTGSAGSDCWQYAPPVYNADGTVKSGDTWIQYFSFTTNVPVVGAARVAAVGFAIGNYGYVATGTSGTRRLDDCWRFDPTGVEPDNK